MRKMKEGSEGNENGLGVGMQSKRLLFFVCDWPYSNSSSSNSDVDMNVHIWHR